MNKFVAGQPVCRIEDQCFLFGRGCSVNDINLPVQCHGIQVISTHARVWIDRIDASKTVAAKGIACVRTGADAQAKGLDGISAIKPEDRGRSKRFLALRPVLVADKVRTVGDRRRRARGHSDDILSGGYANAWHATR